MILKINTTGYISFVVGNASLQGKNTGDGGLAIEAGLNEPSDVAFDTMGNMYIADSDIRKVNASGYISTFAGAGLSNCTYGGDGGLASQATFHSPVALQMDSLGNMYVSEL